MPRTISRILVPTDFSEASDAALAYAMLLAERFDGSVHLLHVVEDPYAAGAWGSEIYIASIPGIRAGLIDEAAARLRRLITPSQRERLTITSEVRTGFAADAIRDVAEVEGCDLIVMGTHGRSGMAHLLLGSVAEKMVRLAPCPVLTVRGTAAEPVTIAPEFAGPAYVPAE